MVRLDKLTKFKLAAIDLDGTLLGPGQRISPENARAVRRLQQSGVQVALASGRHFINMCGYAAELPDVQWLVSCQGGELADTKHEAILSRTFLPMDAAQEILETGRSLGLSTLVYSIDDVFTDVGWNDGLQFYSDLSGHAPLQVPARELLERPIYKLIWIGNPAGIEAARLQNDSLRAPVQAVRTHARLLEFMPTGVSKASALAVLANQLGVAPSETVVFGDGENDIPMFEWAGLSVAMPHGWPAAIKRATHTAEVGPEETALARGVELICA